LANISLFFGALHGGHMVRRVVTLVSLLMAFIVVATIAPRPALADKRVALVIGNGAYRSVGSLPNPANDAAAMGDLFNAAGFDDVRIANDLGVNDLRKELRAFSERAAGADIAVVFYAGHGIEVGGHNYLIPVDAILARDLDVEDETVDLDRVLQLLDPAKRLKLVILDACRNNPFAETMKRTIASRAIGRGLGRPEVQTSNTLVAYAQRAGALASDGKGQHSPFTTALLHHLATPGLDLRIALGNVHDEVVVTSDSEQEPFLYGAMGGGTLALVPGKAEQLQQGQLQQGNDPDAAARADFALAKEADTLATWDSFLGRYPNGFYADLAKAERRKLAATPPQQEAMLAPPSPVVRPSISGPCGGAVLASVSSRSPATLSAQEECALKPKDTFKECTNCPEMAVVPAGSFTMGSPASEPDRTKARSTR
jgi:uncharacterized caspase-like protein